MTELECSCEKWVGFNHPQPLHRPGGCSLFIKYFGKSILWVQNACSVTPEVGRNTLSKERELRGEFWAESLDSGHQAVEGWPAGLRCSTESTHLDLDVGTGSQVLRPCAAVLRGVTLRELLKK